MIERDIESPDTDYVSVSRNYIATNPPTSPSDIKNLLVDYYKENKNDIESLKKYKTNKKYALFEIVFYKET